MFSNSILILATVQKCSAVHKSWYNRSGDNFKKLGVKQTWRVQMKKKSLSLAQLKTVDSEGSCHSHSFEATSLESMFNVSLNICYYIYLYNTIILYVFKPARLSDKITVQFNWVFSIHLWCMTVVAFHGNRTMDSVMLTLSCVRSL